MGMSSSLKRSIWERDNYRCHYCGIEVAPMAKNLPVKATVDHVIPKKKGGPNIPTNLVTACVKCNSHKGDGEFRPYIRHGILIGKPEFIKQNS